MSYNGEKEVIQECWKTVIQYVRDLTLDSLTIESHLTSLGLIFLIFKMQDLYLMVSEAFF